MYTFKWFVLLALVFLLAGAAFVSCGDDDDDDDDNDDSGPDDDDDDDDDDSDLPACDPYAEPARWIDWDLSSMSSEFNEEKGDDGVVTGAVAWSGDQFTLTKNTFSVSGTWNRAGDTPPMTEGQTVKVHLATEAGDDGCCDTETIFVWDETWTLLLAYAWNRELDDPLPLDDPGVTDAETTVTEICEYQEGERPGDADTNWTSINGLSTTGYVNESTFSVDKPGESTTSQDGLYAVHWPIGYRGEILDEDDIIRPTRQTVIEIVSLTDPAK